MDGVLGVLKEVGGFFILQAVSRRCKGFFHLFVVLSIQFAGADFPRLILQPEARCDKKRPAMPGGCESSMDRSGRNMRKERLLNVRTFRGTSFLAKFTRFSY